MLKFVPLPAPLVISQEKAISKTVTSEPLPCRRCLKDGKRGDEMLLLSYDPFIATSPYSGTSPIFVHKKCDQYQSNGSVPEQQFKRTLSIRAYDQNHMMVDFCVIKGDLLQERAEEFLSQTDVAYLHIHYAGPGCFAVRVDRAVV
ncbi:hypothetical protein N7481_013429 [Penicillium waksmanii]|uniref:uncharacterized protein n=1 Tax=Penicillium waksmanii TaxID=69791 RepID=UPI0025484EE2|nr:uncharacterized protein N7481_013429 [Penicillium waksmanii]KAJ5963124.1 hypothetical protein N7481_013429 [Penicillium waksmanii]